MKTVIFLSAVLIASCGVTSKSKDPIQVERFVLTIERIESSYRYNDQIFFIVWKDQRGIEYQEQLRNPGDTNWAKQGVAISQLLKR